MVSDAGSARNRSREQGLHVATEAELSDPHRRARPNRVRLRSDLGLGADDAQRFDGSLAAREGETVLSLGQGLPARVRAVGAGLSFTVSRRSGFRATCARAE